MLLELYDESKKRVDFTDVSVSQLGLSISVLNDHNVHRGLYRLGIDRKDVKYMTVKAILHRNGDLWLTNFSARLSSIDDGGYTPNPDDVNQQILKQNTKIEQNAKEVAIKANSVDVTRDIKDAVQNNNGGGVNLLKGTADFRPDAIWLPLGSWVRTNDKYNGLTIFKGKPEEDWAGITQYYPVKKGETYTFSLNARYESGSGQSSFYILLNADPENGNNAAYVNNNSKSVNLNENWQRLSITFTVNNDGYIKPRMERTNSNKNVLEVCGFKLERGTVATPWSPAPEDTSQEIKSAKDAAIQVASDQINIHVNELSTSFDDKLNKRVNEVKTASEKFTSDGIEQTVKKITDVKSDVDGVKSKVDNLKVGGRNLQIGTGDCSLDLGTNGNPLTLEDYDDHTKMIHTTNGGFYTSYSDKSFVPIAGKTYTISADVKGNGTLSGGVFKYEGGDNGNLGTFQVTDSWQRVSNTVYINEIRGQWIFYPSNSTDFYLKHLKIEEGNMATDWTPAPEDINQQIVNTNKKIDTQTLDSANIDNMRTQGHYFVRNLTGNPLGGGWVYVDVIGNNSDRIRQDVYQDNGSKHMYRRLFGSSWSDWEQGAYLSDVNSLKTEVTASVKNLGDRVTTEVNSITSKINSNNGGGINLVKKSSFHNIILSQLSPTWAISPRVSIDNGTIKNGAIKIDSQGSSSWSDIQQQISVDPDTDYTFSMHLIWGKADKNFHAHIFMVEYEDDGKTISPYADHSHDIANNAARSANTYTIHTSKNTHSIRLYIRAEAGSMIELEEVKLERGSIATPWSPSPADTDAVIESINTKLDVANGQIQGKVTETQVQDLLNRGHYATQEWSQGQINLTKDQFNVDIKKVTSDLNSRVNEVKTASEKFTSDGIEQTVRKITDVKNQVDGVNDRVNNLKVGTSNLLHHSDIFDGWYKGSTITISSNKYLNGNIAILAPDGSGGNALASDLDGPYDDQPITWTVYAKADSAGAKLHTELWGGGGLTDLALTTEWKKYEFTGHRDSRQHTLFFWGCRGNKGNVYVALPFAVVGNMAGTWSPNPDDVDIKFQYKEVTGSIDFNDLPISKHNRRFFIKMYMLKMLQQAAIIGISLMWT